VNQNAAVLNDKLLLCHFVFKHHGLLLPSGQMYHTAIDLESLFKYQHRFRFETVARKEERERGQEQQTGSSRETKRALYYSVKVLSFLKNKGNRR